MHSLKLFATVPSLQLEMGVWGEYDHSQRLGSSAV